mgnify:CR=1 FL=1
MDHFAIRNGVMHAEDLPLSAIAEAVGTPVYVYSRATLERHARELARLVEERLHRDVDARGNDPAQAFSTRLEHRRLRHDHRNLD